MASQTLREARKYEEAAEKLIGEDQRPKFHLASRVGWMNDPNGFSYFNGEYHMFYQYYPYESKWGPMHWGHAVSKDLLHWEYRPAALAPDEKYDRDGCFSGSSVELSDGRQLLMYTGVLKEHQGNDEAPGVQTQCIAVGDGIDYKKYEHNPVIAEDMLPEGSSRYDFRDPKIWKKNDGTFCCVVGGRKLDDDGQILLFSSPDGFSWKFEKVLFENNGRFGNMLECPDFFSLDGQWALLTSPQNMLPKGFEFHNGNGTLCLLGDFDEETNAFKETNGHSIDYGIDFYAPQTTTTPDGRRVMIGWMQNWDTCNLRSKDEPWFGQMSLPRELFVKNGRLYQKPIRELDEMRANKVVHKDITFSGELSLEGVKGRCIDMELELRPADTEKLYQKFSLQLAKNQDCHTSLSFRPHESILKVDRKFSGSRRAIIHQRRCLVNNKDKTIKLRVILDRFSVEVFINDGEQVMTATLYTELSADAISFVADGQVSIDVVKYDLI